MLSKLMQSTRILASPYSYAWLHLKSKQLSFRNMGAMVPPSQYDMPIPKRLRLSHTLRVYWEIIPLFVSTCFALTICCLSIMWACKNKMDVVFTPSSPRENLSRTMDLRHPKIHKLLVINQRYEPWPEMQDVLDKMKAAEHKLMARAMACPQH